MPLPDERTAWPPASSYVTALRAAEVRWRPPVAIDRKTRAFEPYTTYTERTLRVPVVSDLATASADMLFGDETQVIAGDENVDARLRDIMDEADVSTALVEGAEWASALGGVYMRVAWDSDLASVPLVAPVSPLATANAVFAYGRLRSVLLWEHLPEAGNVNIDRWRWTHVEAHSPGLVEHALYFSAKDGRTLGKRVELQAHPVTATLEDEIRVEGNRLLVTYVPNVRPGQFGSFGRPDVQFTDLLDALDDTLTSWMRDVRLGRARIVVPNSFLKRVGRGEGAIFEVDREVFTGMEMGSKTNDPLIEFIQPDIRAEAHDMTFLRLLHAIIQAAGYSPESFGERSSGVAETASAMRVRERRSFRTTDRKARYWIAGIRDISQSMLAVDNTVFGARHDLNVPLSVELGDALAASPLELAQTAAALYGAQAASVEERVRTVHPEWDDDAVVAEVQRITAEMGVGQTVDAGDELPGV